jgi:hypothetical protein
MNNIRTDVAKQLFSCRNYQDLSLQTGKHRSLIMYKKYGHEYLQKNHRNVITVNACGKKSNEIHYSTIHSYVTKIVPKKEKNEVSCLKSSGRTAGFS